MNAILNPLAGRRCVLYARYSSDLQNDKSIDDQFASLRERANMFGWKIVHEYADRALSGTSLKREALMRLMDDAKQDQFDVVLAEGLDRISRNQMDSHFFYQSMEFLDVQIYTLADSSFLDAMHVTFRSLQHAQYIKTLGLNVRRGQVGVVNAGRGIGTPPFGYKIVRTTEQTKGVWEIDEDQAEIVRRIYTELAAGKSALSIVRDLNSEKIANPTARQKKWRQDQILGSRKRQGGIARNPLYRGLYIWGKSKIRRAADGTAVSRATPEVERIVYQRPDLKIVDEEVWNAVQQRLNTRNTLPLHRRKRPPRLLSGLMFCGCCGGSYVVGAHDRVRCANKSERGDCDNRRAVRRAEIESVILEALSSNVLSEELIADYVAEYTSACEKQHDERQRTSHSMSKREGILNRERQHLMEKITSGRAQGAVGDYILDEIRKRTEEIEGIQQKKDLPEARAIVLSGSEIMERFRSQVVNFQSNLGSNCADGVAAREAIRALIDRITITPIGNGNKRGSGAVSIEVCGKIADIISLAEAGSVRSTQLCWNIPTQHNLTNRAWSITKALANNPPLAGRHADRPYVLAALSDCHL